MDITGASTAIMLAAAAVLWFLYLMPTWFRRRQYLATERNATRLQRTIRIMAETAEVPEAVRVEANAREVAQRERLVRQEQRRADAVARARMRASVGAATNPGVSGQSGPLRRPASAELARDAVMRLRMRRTRRLASLMVMTGLAAGGFQLWLMVTTGAVLGSWLVVGASGASFLLGSRMQGMLNRRSALLRVAAAPRRATRWQEQSLEADADGRGWTPVPVPKPLYLERGEAPRVAASTVDAEALLRAAAAEAERALRAAHAEPEVVAFPAASSGAEERSAGSRHEARPPSRYAQMGIVDPQASHAIDLDEALRRRRA